MTMCVHISILCRFVTIAVKEPSQHLFAVLERSSEAQPGSWAMWQDGFQGPESIVVLDHLSDYNKLTVYLIECRGDSEEANAKEGM